MYGNQIIKKFSHQLKHIPKKWKCPIYHNQLKQAIKSIRSCHHFYLGSYSDMEESINKRFTGKRLFGGPFGNVNLPYPEILVCFRLARDVKFGILVKRFYDRTDAITLEYFVSSNKGNSWLLLPIIKLYSINGGIVDNNMFKDISDKAHFICCDPNDPYKNEAICPTTKDEEERKEFLYGKAGVGLQKIGASVVNHLLIILGYKSVITETVRKDKPGSKKRRSVNRLFDYKILKVVMTKSSKRYTYDQKDSESKRIVPFTSVMWYEKTYYEDAPMFGNPKLVGTYAVPEHHRGSKKVGFISKDYDVREKKKK